MTEPWTVKRRDELLTRTSRTTVLTGALALVATAGLSYGLATATTLLASGTGEVPQTVVAAPAEAAAVVTSGSDDDGDSDEGASTGTSTAATAATGTTAGATTTTTTPAAPVRASTSAPVATTGGS